MGSIKQDQEDPLYQLRLLHGTIRVHHQHSCPQMIFLNIYPYSHMKSTLVQLYNQIHEQKPFRSKTNLHFQTQTHQGQHSTTLISLETP